MAGPSPASRPQEPVHAHRRCMNLERVDLMEVRVAQHRWVWLPTRPIRPMQVRRGRSWRRTTTTAGRSGRCPRGRAGLRFRGLARATTNGENRPRGVAGQLLCVDSVAPFTSQVAVVGSPRSRIDLCGAWGKHDPYERFNRFGCDRALEGAMIVRSGWLGLERRRMRASKTDEKARARSGRRASLPGSRRRRP